MQEIASAATLSELAICMPLNPYIAENHNISFMDAIEMDAFDEPLLRAAFHLILPMNCTVRAFSVHNDIQSFSPFQCTCSDRTCQHVTQHITAYIIASSRMNILFRSQPLFLSLLIHSTLFYIHISCALVKQLFKSKRAIVTS